MSGNEVGGYRPRGDRLGAGRNARRLGVGLAGRRADPARVLRRRQPVCGRTAPRHRCRARRCSRCSRPGSGRGDVRRASPDARPHRDHRGGRRLQGVADPPRITPRAARGSRLGRAARRGAWTVGSSGARRSLRPPRDARGRRRDVRRSALAPTAAGCPYPSAGTRGAARASSCPCSLPCTGTANCIAAARCGAGTCPGSGSDAKPESNPESSPESNSRVCDSDRGSGRARQLSGSYEEGRHAGGERKSNPAHVDSRGSHRSCRICPDGRVDPSCANDADCLGRRAGGCCDGTASGFRARCGRADRPRRSGTLGLACDNLGIGRAAPRCRRDLPYAAPERSGRPRHRSRERRRSRRRPLGSRAARRRRTRSTASGGEATPYH